MRARSAEALGGGALAPIPTRGEVVEEGGIPFSVRVVSGPLPAFGATRAQRGARANPFLPYEPELFVADLSETHVCLLNKFNVHDHHVLMVTRAFEEQQSELTARDFAALWTGLSAFDGLAFYNAGPEAGASQRHKHLQQIPLPLSVGPHPTPIEAALGALPGRGRIGAATSLPFPHALAPAADLARLSPAAAAPEGLARYRAMLRSVGVADPSRPYNLLVTRRWMLLVPRARGAVDGIEVNALGYAGGLLVRDAAQLERLRRRGPLRVLREAAGGGAPAGAVKR